MNATDIVGYGFEGDVYCPECLKTECPQTLTCQCAKDKNGICEENCNGYGPNPIFADADESDVTCSLCWMKLIEE
jgi:hypothetical protein